MLAKSVLFLATAALALAAPLQRREGSACAARPKPVLPLNGGAKELAPPVANVTLKHIALGFGIQNYSCSDASSDPLSTGALAMLYDITKLYPKQAASSLDLDAWNALSSTALRTHPVPLNPVSTASGADATTPFPEDAPLELDGLAAPIPFLGHHFFTADGVPQFNLNGDAEVLRARKIDAVDAPAEADAGPDETGAVAWLLLGDKGDSKGLSYVYRVLTSGGNPHGCETKGQDSTSYTATYWFYG